MLRRDFYVTLNLTRLREWNHFSMRFYGATPKTTGYQLRSGSTLLIPLQGTESVHVSIALRMETSAMSSRLEEECLN